MIEPNNIYFGDCYKLIKEIPDGTIDLIYTDIPYDFNEGGGGGCFGSKAQPFRDEYLKVSKNTRRDFAKEYEIAKKKSGGLDLAKRKQTNDVDSISFGIDYQILDEWVRVLKAINIYIWCSKLQIPKLIDYFVAQKGCVMEILTWHKVNAIPACGNSYMPDTEYCLFFREAGKTRVGGTVETKAKYYLSPTNKTDKDRFSHPTIKPLAFVQNHIINSCPEGGVVLDTFMGSGTTCVAAKNTGRKYIGFEIDAKYYEVAKKRLKNEQANGQITMFTM